jgi:NAD(P)-dependent dehydrogenase (short-subunit alcohol dehydrogenase family)
MQVYRKYFNYTIARLYNNLIYYPSAVGALMDISQETFNQCINTNVYGTLAMTRAVAKHMAKRGSGKIVNVGSVVGYVSTPWAGMIILANENIFFFSFLF